MGRAWGSSVGLDDDRLIVHATEILVKVLMAARVENSKGGLM
jgi:hypothetical protein